MKIFILLLLLIISNTFILFSQPAIQWEKCLGGNWDESAYSIEQTSDGGYIAAGKSSSWLGDVTGNHDNGDVWVVKLDSSGNLQWEKCLGGSDIDYANSIQQTSDGGYILGATTRSHDFDVMVSHGPHAGDFWIVKLDDSASIQWQKCLGGINDEYANSIQQTSDGGYIAAGGTTSNDHDVMGNHSMINLGSIYYDDCWIVKLDSSGTLQWQKCLGGSGIDYASSIKQTIDGGYIVGCNTLSNDSDVSGNHGNSDFWLVKLNNSSSIQWQKCLGGTNQDDLFSVQQTTDSGYVVAGYSYSNNGNVSGNHGLSDVCIMKLDNSGSLQWQKCLGGSLYDEAHSIQQTADGGFIIAGYSASIDGDVTNNHSASGALDYWIVKLNDAGTIEWQKCLGGSGNENANSIKQTNDGGYIVAGYSTSIDGDVTNINWGSVYSNFWIVKLSPIVGINEINKNISEVKVSPNPISKSASVSFYIFQKEDVAVNIYDITGRLVKSILHSKLDPGNHSLTWDVNENRIETGVYLLSVLTDNGIETKMINVIK